MKTVELAPGIRSTILGFGCAPILGAVGGRAADTAMAAAVDGGINHFDIARSYGYGEAEKFVGRFLRGRREQVVLASKFGIRATWKAGLLRPLKPLVRAVKAGRDGGVAAASGGPAVPVQRSDPFHQRVELTAANMRKSLEQSLRALGTDHLDLFFVHEPQDEIARIDELSEAAAALKDEGKIRAWGLAFDWSMNTVLKPQLRNFDVLQFNCSPAVAHYPECCEARGEATNVIFSPFRGTEKTTARKCLRTLWSAFESSVVLCSMFNPQHVADNISAAEEHG